MVTLVGSGASLMGGMGQMGGIGASARLACHRGRRWLGSDTMRTALGVGNKELKMVRGTGFGPVTLADSIVLCRA